MASNFSTADIELLGYVDVVESIQSPDNLWVIYKAKALAGLEHIEATFLYLKSDCTVESARLAARQLQNQEKAYVVHPKSLKITPASLSSIFSRNSRVYAHEDLIWDKLKSSFADYVESLRSNITTEKYYVPPRKEAAPPDARLDEEVINYLRGKGEIRPGEMAVICASAGVGKTTLARQLVTQLAKGIDKERIIPTYVEASHWGKLQLDTIDELWDVIRNSLLMFSGETDIRKHLFEYALQQGYIVFIFDGFDELCSHRQSKLRPNEILENLASIASKSDARILITTRTLYWQAEIKSVPENVKTLQLAPFNTQQAKGYFTKFFGNAPKARENALSFYSDIVQGSRRPPNWGGTRAQFVNLPLCVVTVAEYVQLGGQSFDIPEPGRLLEKLLLGICDREIGRKSLQTTNQNQIAALEAIAVDDEASTNPEFSLDLLAVAGFYSEDISKLIDHPLLTIAANNKYKFSYDFLAPYLRAMYLGRSLSDGNDHVPDDAWQVMVHEAHGQGFVIEHLVEILGPNTIECVARAFPRTPNQFRDAKSFLFHLAQIAVECDTTIKTSRERTDAILGALFGDSYLKQRTCNGLFLTGQIERLNFTGISFSHCTFHDVAFDKCAVDSTTVFDRCTFSGNLEFGGDAKIWGGTKLVDPTMLTPANLSWDLVLATAPGDKEDYIKDALRLGLNKFWHSGRLKASIRKEYWNKGILGQTKYCKPLLESMLRNGLLFEKAVSGVTEGGYIFDHNHINDLQRFMDNRQLTGKIRVVFDDLMKKIN